MEKMYINTCCAYPHIPEDILTSSANSLIDKLKTLFPHIDRANISKTIYRALPNVDDSLLLVFGGTSIAEDVLRERVDIALELHIASIFFRTFKGFKGPEDDWALEKKALS